MTDITKALTDVKGRRLGQRVARDLGVGRVPGQGAPEPRRLIPVDTFEPLVLGSHVRIVHHAL